MRLSRFLLLIVIVTTTAIMYINQQTHILLTNYNLQKNQATYGYLLDRQKELLYNVAEAKSPQRLQKVLVAKNINMHRPSRNQVVKIVKAETPSQAVAGRPPRGLFGFLTSQAQAQARSLK